VQDTGDLQQQREMDPHVRPFQRAPMAASIGSMTR
jgi:hypothetical protein